MNEGLGRAEFSVEVLNNAGRVGQCCACCCQGYGPEGVEAEAIFQGRGSVCHLLLSVKMLSLFLFYRAENKPTCLRRLFLMRLKIFKNIFL